MDADLRHRLNYEIRALESVKANYMSRLEMLKDCKGALLKRTRNHGSDFYYYIKRPGSGVYKYLGKPAHVDVRRVREARFLEEAIRRIDNNIDLLRSLDAGFLDYSQNSINESLPASYQCDVAPMSKLYEYKSGRWLSERLAFQKEFPENFPQNKKHRTSDGVWVKTISELTVYERLKAAGLSLIYELPFVTNDYGPVLYPDFTILSPVDMKTEIIVEFAGRMDRYEYREDFAKRVGRLIDSGYVPGVNLFFIFSDRDGNIDSMQINKVIEDILGQQPAVRM